jgi:hypothetical protein
MSLQYQQMYIVLTIMKLLHVLITWTSMLEEAWAPGRITHDRRAERYATS